MKSDIPTQPDPTGNHARVNLQTARLLARKRRYTEAASCLAQTLAAGGCTEVEALDLQARIFAQQGMLLHAESCWRRAAALAPDNLELSSALAKVHKLANPAQLNRSIGLLIARSLPILAMAAAIIALWIRIGKQETYLRIQMEEVRNVAQRTSTQSGEALAEIHARINTLQRLGEQASSQSEEALERIEKGISTLATLDFLTQTSNQTATRLEELEQRILEATEKNQTAIDTGLLSSRNTLAEMIRTTSEGQAAQLAEQDQKIRVLVQREEAARSSLAELSQQLSQATVSVEAALAEIRIDLERYQNAITRNDDAALERETASPSGDAGFGAEVHPNGETP